MDFTHLDILCMLVFDVDWALFWKSSEKNFFFIYLGD